MEEFDSYNRLSPLNQDVIYLDANESPFNSPENRYPLNELAHLKEQWGRFEHIPSQCVYFCNGTEEAVDLCMRVFTDPGQDEILSVSPTRSIYARRARINRLKYVDVSLNQNDFSLDLDSLMDHVKSSTKIIFLCSPNSPTGNVFNSKTVELLLTLFEGWVILDESYIDFVPQKTLLTLLNRFSNLVILRSFSHAWASAGIRMATIVSRPEVIDKINGFGFTHPISSLSINYLEGLLKRRLDVFKWTRQIVEERNKVIQALSVLPNCVRVFPSETNFVLVKFSDVKSVYNNLKEQNIAVRLVDGFIRITIGLPVENSALIGALRKM